MAGAPPSRFLQLAFCVAGIYAAYLVFSVLQESLFKAQPDGTTFTFTAFVLMVQCFFNLVVALILDWLQDGPGSAFTGNRQPTGYKWLPSLAKADVCFTAFVYVMAMFTSNESLKYVTYPTQTLAKSCKLIPVMLGRVIYLRKRYSVVKYLCVLLMTVGIAAFQMSGKKHMATEGFGGEGFGLALCGVSLVLDGLCGPQQETLRTAHRLTNNQQMIVNNAWATLFMAAVAGAMGQLGVGVAYVASHPDILQLLVLLGLCSAVGQTFIFYTIRTFDSLTLSTITTTRKFFPIITSVAVHGHVLLMQQWVAVFVVFAGLALELVDSERERRSVRSKEAAGRASRQRDLEGQPPSGASEDAKSK